ncbi:hypothetical protein ACFQXA_24360 [Nocardiopsis composta]
MLASAVLLALLLGAQALRIHDDEARTAPMEVSGTASEAVDARSFTVEVVDVAFARSVYDASRLSVGDEDEADAAAAEDAIEANGVWVVVTADITAAERPLNRVNAELETGEGTTYSSSTMSVNALGSISDVFSPGIPGAARWCSSCPRAAVLPSVRFNVHSGLDKRLSGSALVDLELSGSELKKAVDGAEEALAVPQSEIRKA